MTRGIFISIEGGEGVGKSLFTKNLQEALQRQKIKVSVTREPGGTPTAQAIRGLFMNPPADDPLAPMTELMLVSAARHQHVKRLIEPNLNSGSWILCDRFTDSSRIYQGTLGGIPEEELESVIKMSVGQCEPTLTLLLDCDTEVALARLGQREEGAESGNRYDAASLDFHRRLREAFLALARRYPERIAVLRAEESPEEVLAQAKTIISTKLGIAFE